MVKSGIICQPEITPEPVKNNGYLQRKRLEILWWLNK